MQLRPWAIGAHPISSQSRLHSLGKIMASPALCRRSLQFEDELYSKEELIAEMGAAFLWAIAGIANEYTDRNTTAYLHNWISKLEEDNRLIVHAAANAQKQCIGYWALRWQERLRQ